MSAVLLGNFGTLLESKSVLFLKSRIKIMADSRPSSDIAKFRSILKESKNVLILSGAGISAESGIPTFRGAGGLWRKYQAPNLATPQAFKANPGLVWEFYHYRREFARQAQPNAAHIAVARFERNFHKDGRVVTIVTQNIDNLHARAGSLNIIELHGNLYKTRCTKCKKIEVNNDSPICEALAGRGDPDPEAVSSDIPEELLPRCKVPTCNGLLRPHIVWFGENLETSVIDRAQNALSDCDICLIIGTSSVVYPAAMFAPQAASRGVPVAEFNIEPTSATEDFGFYFEGKCGTTVPQVLDYI